MFWSRSFRIVLISILINDYLQIALRLIKDYLSGFWSFGTCRRHVFLIFCSSAGAEASFLSFFGFRHLPKTWFSRFSLRRQVPKLYFLDFLVFGTCRRAIFPIFTPSVGAETLFSIRNARMGGHLQHKTVYSCHEQTLMYVYLGIFGQ